ncbi:hypothetical protein [Halomonas denitrificans]|nr:hypothetical protein [Halomonas denitrificans]
MARTLIGLSAAAVLAGCVVHPHRTHYATWHDHRAAHPHARYVVVHHRPAPDRTCWKVTRGWRCVAR